MPRFRTDDGADLFYRIRGTADDAPPLILIHGWCSNLAHWEPLARHFARRHRVLAVDRRGMGRSTSPQSAYGAQQHAADTVAIAKHEDINRAIVIGHAGGGPVALTLARRYPRLTKALVMVDSPLYPLPRLGDPSSAFGTVLGEMIDALEAPNGKRALKEFYTGYFSRQCNRAMRDQAIADALQTPLAVAADGLRMMVVDTEALADEIRQPVLWLSADQVDQDYIGSHLRNVQFGVVVGSGHFPHLEVPAQTNAMIETFIAHL